MEDEWEEEVIQSVCEILERRDTNISGLAVLIVHRTTLTLAR